MSGRGRMLRSWVNLTAADGMGLRPLRCSEPRNATRHCLSARAGGFGRNPTSGPSTGFGEQRPLWLMGSVQVRPSRDTAHVGATYSSLFTGLHFLRASNRNRVKLESRSPVHPRCAELVQRAAWPHAHALHPSQGLITKLLRGVHSMDNLDGIDKFMSTDHCRGSKLCDDPECWICTEKSWKTHPKVDLWSDSNKLSPRQVRLSESTTMIMLLCEECKEKGVKTDVEKRPRAVKSTSKILCDACKHGERIPLEDVWSTRNSLNIDDVKVGEDCWLFCNTCHHHYVRPVPPDRYLRANSNARHRRLQCPYCRDATSRRTHAQFCSDSTCQHCRSRDTWSVTPPGAAFEKQYSAINSRPLSDNMLRYSDPVDVRRPHTRRKRRYWIEHRLCPHRSERGEYCRHPALVNLETWSTHTAGVCEACRERMALQKSAMAYKKLGAKYKISREEAMARNLEERRVAARILRDQVEAKMLQELEAKDREGSAGDGEGEEGRRK